MPGGIGVSPGVSYTTGINGAALSKNGELIYISHTTNKPMPTHAPFSNNFRMLRSSNGLAFSSSISLARCTAAAFRCAFLAAFFPIPAVSISLIYRK